MGGFDRTSCLERREWGLDAMRSGAKGCRRFASERKIMKEKTGLKPPRHEGGRALHLKEGPKGYERMVARVLSPGQVAVRPWREVVGG